MTFRVLVMIGKGVLGGAILGFLVTNYVLHLTNGYVVQRDDFAYPLAYEQAQQRYATTLLLAFVIVFAGAGPLLVAASFSPWMKHAVYGLVCGVGLTVFVALFAATIAGERPFRPDKVGKQTCMDFAHHCGIPIAMVAGPLIGVWAGKPRRSPLKEISEEP